MTEAVFHGRSLKGEFHPDLREQWDIWHDHNEGKRVVVSISLERQYRSLAQNRRYWSLVLPVVRECINVERDKDGLMPLSKDQIHWALKGALIGWEETPLGKVPKSSKELDVPGFADFCRQVEEWIATKWGVALPERGEDR